MSTPISVNPQKLPRAPQEQLPKLVERLEQRARMFDAALSSITDFVYIFDRSGRFVYANQALLDLWGLKSHEAIGKNFFDLKYPSDLAACLQGQIHKVLNTRQELTGETPYTSPSGTSGFYEYIFCPVIDAAGDVELVAGTTRDITQRKLAEKELAQRTAQYQTLFNQAPMGVYVVDSDFRVLDVNPAALPVFAEVSQLIGRDFSEVIRILWPAPYADEVIARFRHTLETGESYFVPERMEERLDSGVREFYEYQINRIPLPEGRYGVVCYFRDISAQVNARLSIAEAAERYRDLSATLEGEVRARTKELEQRNADLLQQSDQLRNLSARLMQMQDEERRHIARELHDSTGQILTTLGMNLARLVKYAKQDSPELATEAAESGHLVQQLSREIRTSAYLLHPPLLDENGLSDTLKWYIDGLKERSGLDTTLTVCRDFGRLPGEIELVLFRVVQECLTNVHRHSGSKSAAVCLTRSMDSVSLEVQDKGVGIAPEKLSGILTGLGVGVRGMCERIRHLHGEMKMDSDHRGTRIVVTLPITSSESLEDKLKEGQIHDAG